LYIKNKTSFAGGVLGFLVTFTFGLWLIKNNVPQSTASWTMWAMLDFCSLILTLKALKSGDARPYLLFGWTLAATFVVVILIFNGTSWTWGWTEWLSACGVVTAARYWVKNQSIKGLWACAIAMNVAGIPLAYDFWIDPQQSTWWVWAGTILSCALSIAGSDKLLSIEKNLVPASSFLYNILLLSILFR
jgi:hypothetical protein